MQGGRVTADVEAYLRMRTGYGAPGTGPPFHQVMGGINVTAFGHQFPTFSDTNNLSHTYFVEYGGFKILFPGDLERDGWEAHLRDPTFVQHLQTTTALVASHHGRENGFSEAVFRVCRPDLVIVSDCSIVHDTQATSARYLIAARGCNVQSGGRTARRFVLTTRNDGDIVIRVDAGTYTVATGAD